MATTFYDLLTPAQQADVTTLGIDFNAQVNQIIAQNANAAANLTANQKLGLQAKITAALPNMSQTQENNLHTYLTGLGLNLTTSLFQQLTPAQLQQVLTIITT